LPLRVAVLELQGLLGEAQELPRLERGLEQDVQRVREQQQVQELPWEQR
jgi:hypothetical protein